MPMRAIYLFAVTALIAIPALAANPGKPGSAPKPSAPRPAAKVAAPKTKEFGGAMPLPVDQHIERQNSAQDKLLVEITHSEVVGNTHVAYVKVVWGDLDNVIKKDGKQFYSNWNGNLKLTAPATGGIDQKIQFDDGGKATTRPKAEPKPGTGRDEVEIKMGPEVEWESGVVGALDGLRIKITSTNANISGVLTAGKFTIPITITGGTSTVTTSAPPPANGGSIRVLPSIPTK